MKVFYVFCLVIMVIGLTSCDNVIVTKSLNNNGQYQNIEPNIQSNANENIVGNQISDLQKSSDPENSQKISGCWSGMRGGKVKIENNKITDFTVNETGAFKVVSHKEKKGETVYDLEEYLLQANYDFPKGFLDIFIKLKIQNDEFIYITSYKTLDDYQVDHLSGGGTFAKTDCNFAK